MGKIVPPILPPPAAQDEGTTIIPAATAFDFRGTGVTVTDAGLGVARVTINSGAGTGDLLAINDLNDVDNPVTALGNLGGAPLASPTFTGVPAAPTAAADTNTTQLATTAFVQQELAQVAYIDGEVEFYANLPITLGTPPIDSAYLVRESSGIWLLTRKPAGIYVRLANAGALTDWTYAGEFVDIFNDANFTIYDSGDSSKQVQFQVSGLTASTVRTLSVPDANGTIALTGAAPTAHAASHITGGADIIAAATTTAVGLTPVVTAPAAGLLSVLGVGNGETVRTDKAIFDVTNPAALGAVAPGTAIIAARRDHVHAMPSAGDVGAATAAQGATADTAVQPAAITNMVTAAAVIGNTKLVVGSGGSRGVAESALTAAFAKVTAGVPAAVTVDGTAAEVVLGRSTASSGDPELLATTGTRGSAVVLATSPTLVTPILGVASATSLATSAATPLLLTNGQLVNIALTSQTTGATTLTIPDFASVVDEFTFKTKAQTMSNKTFVAPALGTPTSGTLTNVDGIAKSLTAGNVPICSYQNFGIF